LQQAAQTYVDTTISAVKDAIKSAIHQRAPLTLSLLKKQHALLKQRMENTKPYQEEGEYLRDKYPQFASELFNMDVKNFLHTAKKIKKDRS
jgi:malonate decarboxylase beta subunit